MSELSLYTEKTLYSKFSFNVEVRFLENTALIEKMLSENTLLKCVPTNK